jgi:cation diffusion facilitator family transporter
MQITVARAQQEDDSFPYGQRRAEVVGGECPACCRPRPLFPRRAHGNLLLAGLVNAVSLCALSLYITLGAVPLLASPEEVNATWVYIAVAGCGIAVNLVGVYFFLRAGLGCSHTHSLTESPSRTHHEEEEARASMSINGLVEEASNNIELLSPMSRLLEETKVKSSQSFPVAPPLPAPAPCSGHHHHNHGNMNLWAVAVHSAVDSFSSLVICLMGLMMRFMGDPDGRDWTDYLDPCTAILLAGVSVYFAWPIVAETIRVVMEGTPRSIQPSIVKKSLMCVGGVQAVEDLAVTQLSASYKVASVRLVCSGDGAHSCGQVLKAARSVLLGFGIDRSTIEVIDLHHHVDL